MQTSNLSRTRPPLGTMTSSQHAYEVRLCKDHRGVDLISDALPFGRLWYGEQNAISNAINYAKFCSRSRHAVIRVYDEAGNVKIAGQLFFGASRSKPRSLASNAAK
jgi:hypothetical protein